MLKRLCPKCRTTHTLGTDCPQKGFGKQLPGRRRLTTQEKQQVWKRCRGRCVMCGVSGKRTKLQYDHIIPHKEDGPTTVRNTQLLCVPCHNRKGGEDRKRQRALGLI